MSTLPIDACKMRANICSSLFLRPVATALRGVAASVVSGQLAQPIQLASLKLSMAVYSQKLDGRPPDVRPKQLTPPAFGSDIKLGVPCLDAACIVGLN